MFGVYMHETSGKCEVVTAASVRLTSWVQSPG